MKVFGEWKTTSKYGYARIIQDDKVNSAERSTNTGRCCSSTVKLNTCLSANFEVYNPISITMLNHENLFEWYCSEIS